MLFIIPLRRFCLLEGWAGWYSSVVSTMLYHVLNSCENVGIRWSVLSTGFLWYIATGGVLSQIFWVCYVGSFHSIYCLCVEVGCPCVNSVVASFLGVTWCLESTIGKPTRQCEKNLKSEQEDSQWKTPDNSKKRSNHWVHTRTTHFTHRQ
jgi:hypothetical protein